MTECPRLSRPFSAMSLAVATLPCSTTASSGVVPSCVGRLASHAARASRSSTTAEWPSRQATKNGVSPGRGAGLPLSAGVHLSVLSNSHDRMYLWARSAEVGTQWQPRPRAGPAPLVLGLDHLPRVEREEVAHLAAAHLASATLARQPRAAASARTAGRGTHRSALRGEAVQPHHISADEVLR